MNIVASRSNKIIRGTSITIVIGSYGGFYIQRSIYGSVRICLGWIAVIFYRFDIEAVLELLLNKKATNEIDSPK
jgi:hypothetical protein